MEKTEPLDEFLEENGYDGFLLYDDSSNSNIYYLTEFEAADPFVYLRFNGKSVILVSQLEYSRAKEDAEVDEVISTAEFTDGESQGNEDARIQNISRLLEKYGVEELTVPEEFPLGLAEKLRDEGIELSAVEDRVMEARQIKEPGEIDKLRQAQETTEKAMEKAEKLIREAEIEQGKLYLDGEVLSSERLRKKIKLFLFENNYEVPEETIVACGAESAKPHSTGTGALRPGEPIVIDIFPRYDRYFGDMTRTFVKGEPDEEVKEMKEAVLEAQEAAFELLEKDTGVKASEIHNKVCNILEEHGYNTLRNGDAETGFIHSTGHAVGLDLHEPPRIAGNDDELKPGMVLTIEPGLYIPEVGGVRIEDMILVKEDGYENFNSMHKKLEID